MVIIAKYKLRLRVYLGHSFTQTDGKMCNVKKGFSDILKTSLNTEVKIY